MFPKNKIKWLSKPEDHDYPAALSYLTLIYDPKTATGLVNKLKKAPVSEFKAEGYFPGLSIALAGGGQFARQKGHDQNRVRMRSIAAPADQGFSQWQGGHRRRLPPALCCLHV